MFETIIYIRSSSVEFYLSCKLTPFEKFLVSLCAYVFTAPYSFIVRPSPSPHHASSNVSSIFLLSCLSSWCASKLGTAPSAAFVANGDLWLQCQYKYINMRASLLDTRKCSQGFTINLYILLFLRLRCFRVRIKQYLYFLVTL